MPPKVVQAPSVGTEANPKAAHKCVMCELALPTKSALQDHFRLHANGTIDMKGRTVRRSEVRKVETDPPKAQTDAWISCDVCLEKFETVTLAIQHKFKKHPNSNVKYFCGFCGKQYPLEICKTNHIKTDHRTEKRSSKLYKCKDCTAEFFTVEAIKYHIKSSHQRVTALINPVATLGPSKKIKMNISGERSSVYYCHLCGQEYMVKFNLQKHLETYHTGLERNKPAEQLIKCKLCEAIFYNKLAWQSHNLLHTPSDLYLNSEADRKLAVTRVDQDFDQSRVPTLLDKLIVGRAKKMTPEREMISSKSKGSGLVKTPPPPPPAPTEPSPSPAAGGRNRAVVDSDSENDRSDTSIESEEEREVKPKAKNKRRLPQRKKRKIKNVKHQ